MDKIESYRQIIIELLEKLGQARVLGTENADEFETQVIADTQHNHFQLLHLGWKDQERTFGVSIHIDIKNDKIWIQKNSTDIDLANELVRNGVPPNDIVLGLHSPSMRKYTDFAVA